jgi:hypothetical protein
MDEKTKELYARQKDEELREQELRLQRLEAGSRAHKAGKQFEEVSGLRALHDRIGEKVQKLHSEASANADRLHADIQKDWSDFKSRIDAAQKKDMAVEDAQLASLSGRVDQLNAGIDELLSRSRQDVIGQRIEVREAMDDLQAKRRAAAERRKEVEAAEDQASEEMDEAFDEAVQNLARAYDTASKKVDAARASAQAGDAS